MGQTPKILIPAIRQYCHNTGKGLLIGYDQFETEKVVRQLQKEIRNLKEAISGTLTFEEAEMLQSKIQQQQEEIEHGDYWMKRATEYLESGSCPICFCTDEAGHKHDCLLGMDEVIIQHQQQTISELEEALEKIRQCDHCYICYAGKNIIKKALDKIKE